MRFSDRMREVASSEAASQAAAYALQFEQDDRRHEAVQTMRVAMQLAAVLRRKRSPNIVLVTSTRAMFTGEKTRDTVTAWSLSQYAERLNTAVDTDNRAGPVTSTWQDYHGSALATDGSLYSYDKRIANPNPAYGPITRLSWDAQLADGGTRIFDEGSLTKLTPELVMRRGSEELLNGMAALALHAELPMTMFD